MNHDTKEDFCRHLTHLGFEIGAPSQWVQQKFRRHVSEERFNQFIKLTQGPRGGKYEDAIYDFFADLVEANLFRSMDPDITLDTSYQLYQMCRPLIAKGAHVVELACWTGGLASFIAAGHPQCTVTAVDRAAKIISLNKSTHKLLNLDFHTWDYRADKPPEIPAADVLLCGLGTMNGPDGGYEDGHQKGIRDSAGYRQHKVEAKGYFQNWRAAAKQGATLLAVLRMTSTFGRFLAYLDAATEAGWTPEFSKWVNITIPTAKQVLPALSYVAKPDRKSVV